MKIFFAIFLILFSCKSLPDGDPGYPDNLEPDKPHCHDTAGLDIPCPDPKPEPKPDPKPGKPAKCALIQEFLKRAQGDVLQMPVQMPMAHEAHYLIKNLDPKVVSAQVEAIKPHLQRTCDKLLKGDWKKFFQEIKSSDCREVYASRGSTEWTPPEPTRGRGSSDYYPSVECEAATGNMYWAKGLAPKKGERFIVQNPENGKAFVLCMGYEAGPGDPAKSGGLSSEGLHYLKAKHGKTKLILGRAVDQTLPYGPVECDK